MGCGCSCSRATSSRTGADRGGRESGTERFDFKRLGYSVDLYAIMSVGVQSVVVEM